MKLPDSISITRRVNFFSMVGRHRYRKHEALALESNPMVSWVHYLDGGDVCICTIS